MHCKSSQRYLVQEEGRVYCYKEGEREWLLTPVEFGFKNSIKTVTLSHNFVVFLNQTGLVYTAGNNSKGQLGLGKISRPVEQPQLVTHLSQQKEIIETISAGMAHVVAKSKLGYVYVWGDNCFQQVSPTDAEYIPTPEPLEIEEGKLRALQAVAGLRTTFVLNEHLKMVGFGTSSSFNTQKSVHNYPLDLLKVPPPPTQLTSNSKHLVEVRLSVQWTH
jgi:alpha-tubulin suppressor-like RCC1 family protein